MAVDDLCLGIWHFQKPTAETPNAVNLVKDTVTPRTVTASATSNYSFARYKFDVPMDFKPGDKFVLSFENVERLAGTATEFHAYLYDMDETQSERKVSDLTTFNTEDRTCILTVVNPSTSGTVELLLYAGLNGATAGNSVRFTRPMLVRGETPAKWNYAASEFNSLNANANYDDGKGIFRFSGFATMYFRVKSVSGSANDTVTIQMREGYEHLRPQPGMHFVAFGNRTNKNRQTCRYATRTYERLMKGVDDWTFGPDNIMLQFGDLSNLSIDGVELSGYSAYLNNVYFTGVIRQLENAPLRLTYETYGNKYVGDGDNCMIQLSAIKGVEDVTADCQWSVKADSGATATVSQSGYLELDKSILAGREETTVTVTATWRKTPEAAPKTAETVIIIRDNALLKGEKGSSYTTNLLKGTKTWNTDYWSYGTGMGQGAEQNGEMNGFAVLHSNFAAVGSQAYIELAQQFFPVVKGQTYTLSFWARGTGSMRTYCYPDVNGFMLPGGTGDRRGIATSDTEQIYQLTSDWKRHRLSFRVDGTPVPEKVRILFRVLAGNEAWIAGAKLETGVNDSPEWSPAQEDLVGASGKDGEDAVSIQVSPGAVVAREGETTVTKVYVDLYRGTRRVKYNDPDDGNMTCTTLTEGGHGDIADGIGWSFNIDSDGRFYYRIGVSGSASNVSLDVPFNVVYNGVNYPQTFSVRTIAKGDTGPTGPQGAVIRIRGLFEAGYYYDGTTAVNENGVSVYWLDVVWVEDSYGNRYYKRCVKSGNYTAANGPHALNPETSAGWADFSQLDNLIVDLLIAKNAQIAFLSGQEIVFGEYIDNGYKIWGRIGVPTDGDGVIMWAGGEDTSRASFLLNKEGRARFGKTTGNHIVIDPDEKQITVRDSKDKKMVSIDGEPHTMGDSFGVADSIDVDSLNGAGYSATTTTNAGSVTFAEDGASLKVSMNARMTVQSKPYQEEGAGGQMVQGWAKANTSVTVTLLKNGTVVKPVSSATGTVRVQSGALLDAVTSVEELSAQWTGLTAGTYQLRIAVTITRETGTDAVTGNTVRGEASVTLLYPVKQIGVPESVRSVICGNGMWSSNSMVEYFRAVKTPTGYVIEASSGNHGVRVSGTGLMAKDSNGGWNATVVTCEKEATDADKCVCEQLGMRMFTTNDGTANLPTTAGSKYGSITVTTLNATAGHHIQEWRSFTQPVECWARRCINNGWGAWVKNY